MHDDYALRLQEAKQYERWKKACIAMRFMSFIATAFVGWHLLHSFTHRLKATSFAELRDLYIAGMFSGLVLWAALNAFFSLGADAKKCYVDGLNAAARNMSLQQLRQETFWMIWAVFFSTPLTWPLGLAGWLLQKALNAHDVRSGWTNPPPATD